MFNSHIHNVHKSIHKIVIKENKASNMTLRQLLQFILEGGYVPKLIHLFIVYTYLHFGFIKDRYK
jgi:hypothetical protein